MTTTKTAAQRCYDFFFFSLFFFYFFLFFCFPIGLCFFFVRQRWSTQYPNLLRQRLCPCSAYSCFETKARVLSVREHRASPPCVAAISGLEIGKRRRVKVVGSQLVGGSYRGGMMTWTGKSSGISFRRSSSLNWKWSNWARWRERNNHAYILFFIPGRWALPPITTMCE